MIATSLSSRKLNDSLCFLLWTNTTKLAINEKTPVTHKLLSTLPDHTIAGIQGNIILQYKRKSKQKEMGKKLYSSVIQSVLDTLGSTLINVKNTKYRSEI